VIISAVYAKAVKLLGFDLYVYRISREKEALAKKYFAEQYGVFSYSHIEKKTYIQSLAQKYRLRGQTRSHSTLYEKAVIPYIQKNHSILDFGAGQRDYAKMLQGKGFNIHTIEFFLRKPGKDVIWIEEIRNDFAKIITQLTFYGQYDVVICDSVLNSIDSLEAQKSVLISLSALCKKGGKIFWSGIPLKFKQLHIDRKNTFDSKESSAFLDEKGFTGNYRYGEWYFQKYHTRNEVEELNSKYFSDRFTLLDRGEASNGELHGSSFQVMTINEKKASEKEMIEALNFEFSLPLPGGKRHNLAPTLLEAWHKSNSIENKKVDNRK
jgi:ParB family chromosome partitioning protein